MSGISPRSRMAWRVGANSTVSWRLAPPAAEATGMPLRSTARDHFQPDLPRSVGFFPVPGPPQGALWAPAVDGYFG